jgi:hypothetical protein
MAGLVRCVQSSLAIDDEAKDRLALLSQGANHEGRMKRLDVSCAIMLGGLAWFVASESLDVRARAEARHRESSGGSVVASPTASAADLTPRVTRSAPGSADVRERIDLAGPSTYLGEVLAAHDSSLARWADRRGRPLRVWIQPYSVVRDWSPAFLPLVRDAFIEWTDGGAPLNFSFALDSASADVHVMWVDRFAEPISGKTLWTHDERWHILDATVMIAVHHRGGEILDRDAIQAISLHEVGHLIGLDHTSDTTSVMAPRVRVKDLSPADRATAQLLYALPAGPIRPSR